MDYKKPRIKPETTVADNIAEVAGWAALTALWIITAVYYPRLPDVIPIHYNILGEPDNFGSKTNILSLPAVSTAVFFALSVLSRFPHVCSYPVKITKENAARQYKYMTRMVRVLKLVLVVIICIIELQTIRIVSGHAGGLGAWFFPVVCAALIIPLFYYIVKLLR